MMFAIGALSLVVITGIMTVTKANKVPRKSSPQKKASPSKFTDNDLKKKRTLAYYLKIVKMLPGFELAFIDSATPGNDGFGQKLFNHIKNEDGFHEDGVLFVVRRRVSKEDNSMLTNAHDTYPRRCILRMVDESTHESRLAMLRAFQTFLMRPENNKYGYQYIVNDASDLTPHRAEDLEPMDHYLQNDMIVNVITNVYENTGINWYANNRECALEFFSGPTFPPYAIEQLGYPNEPLGQGGIAPGFNPPNKN
jgi:hypothetical protein